MQLQQQRTRLHLRLHLILWLVFLTFPSSTEILALESSIPGPGLGDPALGDEPISMNFEQTDIRTVIRTVGEITGINFVLDESVRGDVTVLSPTPIRLADAYRVLASVLQLHGFAAVPTEDLVKVIPRSDAVKHNLPVRIGVNPAEIPLDDTLVTQILPLTHASAAEMHKVVRDLLAPDAKASVYDRTNALVITDTSARIHYVAKLIQPLDVPSPGEQVHLFPLEHASAQDLSEHVTRILGKVASSSTRASRSPTTPSGTMHAIRILPDSRINALVAIGTDSQIQNLSQLIQQLDVPRRAGTENVHVVYLKNAQAKDVAESLMAALSNMRITGGAVDAGAAIQVNADEGTNSLIISGDSPDFEMIDTIIAKLDIVREQVLVEMLIVEVTQEKLTDIGVDWQTLNNSSSHTRGFAGTNLGPRVDFLNGDLEGLAVGAYRGTLGNGTDLVAILAALEKDSDVNLLSQPHITTQNHTKAKIIVADNRAFVTNSRVTEDTNPATPTVIKTFEYKDVGITLDITPHVNQGGTVRLEIVSEISKLLADVTNAGSDTPTTARRSAETIVTMQSGATVVIGGLIRDDEVTVEKKVPLLGDIPGLGALFKHSSKELQKTNLLMFITPHVMSTGEEMAAVTQEKEAMMPDLIERMQHHKRSRLPSER